jgi:hypothetical protein
MKQIIHIFAKDSRHFWPEIVVSLAAMAAFTWTYPHHWTRNNLGGGLYIGVSTDWDLSASVLTLLVPVSWWLLITRVIHAESLVGDRQFWLTRPYEWKKLLGAKLLFLLVYLYVPLVIVKLVLLAQAGFHPLSYMPGLLFNLLLVTAFLVMPLFAVATVTSNFARMALTAVGISLCLVAILVLSAVRGTSVSIPYNDRLSIPLTVFVSVAAITLQYAARRLWLSRLLLIGFPVLTLALGLVSPGQAMMERDYPSIAAKQVAPIQFALLEDSIHQVMVSAARNEKEVAVSVPLEASGVADGYMLMPNHVRVSIEAANGTRWTSPWQEMYNARYLPGPQESTVNFEVKRSIFESVRGMPIILHLTFAFTQLRAGRSRRVPVTASDFPVPGFGICAPQLDWNGSQQIIGVACRSAMRQPRLTYVEALWSDDACGSTATEPNNGVQGSGWTGNPDDDPAEFGISSVWTTGLDLSNSLRDTGEKTRPQKPRYLCPGTPLTFTQYDPVRQIQSDNTIQDFHFAR